MSKIPPIMTAICRSDDKLYMDTPFVIGAFLYATNGTMALRCPNHPSFDVPRPNRALPPVTTAIDWDRDHYAIIADQLVLPEKNQERCKCANGGFTKPNPSCAHCAGSGWVFDDYTPVPVAGFNLGWSYVDLLHKHGIIYVYEMIHESLLYHPSKPEKNPFYFEGENFCGVVMKIQS